MKVRVTYTEVQYFTNTQEVEMTAKEYREYQKTGTVSRELEDDMCSATGDECHQETETVSIIVEKI